MNDVDQKNIDHDLIIKIHTIVERLVVDVKEMKDNTMSRIETLEDGKVNKIDLSIELTEMKKKTYECNKDFEERMRKQEIISAKTITWGAAMLVLVGIIEFLISKFLVI